jgi:exodeoxyribonuclease V
MELSEKQQEAVQRIKNWFGTGRKVFRLFGYAGTGKTTTIATAVQDMGLKVEYVAYTGKAASVMRANGLPADTVHGLIYKLDHKDPTTKELIFGINRQSRAKHADLIVLDECSMVGSAMADDLLSFKVPVLAIGDPAQLPPVKGAGFFVNGNPDALLTEVHRQAQESPVLRMATDVREHKPLALGEYGSSAVLRGDDVTDDDLWAVDQVLVGTNATRVRLNRRARRHFGMTGPYPQFGERLICTRNNRGLDMMNGEMFSVVSCEELDDKWLSMSLATMDRETPEIIEEVPVLKHFFDGAIQPMDFELIRSVHMDFGYAITVHKSQGSQWSDIMVLDESHVFRDNKFRWLYTGITRAQNSVKIVRGRV